MAYKSTILDWFDYSPSLKLGREESRYRVMIVQGRGGVIECEKERQTLFVKRAKYKDAGGVVKECQGVFL